MNSKKTKGENAQKLKCIDRAQQYKFFFLHILAEALLILKVLTKSAEFATTVFNTSHKTNCMQDQQSGRQSTFRDMFIYLLMALYC